MYFARIYKEIEICPFQGVNLLSVRTVYAEHLVELISREGLAFNCIYMPTGHITLFSHCADWKDNIKLLLIGKCSGVMVMTEMALHKTYSGQTTTF